MDVTDSNQMEQPSAPQTNSTRIVAVEFSGKGGEFFGIWIVNVLLSIVTLGIYSAWAKVRTNQYFYGNTVIDGHRFAYLATPMQILKGRLLAVALFACYTLVTGLFPIAGMAFVLVMVFLFPWLINQGLRFNLRMSSYRNVRFSFAGTYGEAFMCFIVLPFVGAITLYLAMPWVLSKIDEYIYSNVRYGDKQLKVDIKTGEYYITALIVVALSFVGFGLLAIVMGTMVAGSGALSGEAMILEDFFNGAGLFIVVGYIVLGSLISALYKARIRNHILNNSEFEQLTKFKSNVEVMPFAMLILTNLLAVLFSFGLAFPWTAIRQARFMADATQLEMDANAAAVIDTMEEQKASFGEEAAEIFDVDVSLG